MRLSTAHSRFLVYTMAICSTTGMLLKHVVAPKMGSSSSWLILRAGTSNVASSYFTRA